MSIVHQLLQPILFVPDAAKAYIAARIHERLENSTLQHISDIFIYALEGLGERIGGDVYFVRVTFTLGTMADICFVVSRPILQSERDADWITTTVQMQQSPDQIVAATLNTIRQQATVYRQQIQFSKDS
jgi:hypothetical protein